MAIDPKGQVTTTGLMNKGDAPFKVPDLSGLTTQAPAGTGTVTATPGKLINPKVKVEEPTTDLKTLLTERLKGMDSESREHLLSKLMTEDGKGLLKQILPEISDTVDKDVRTREPVVTIPIKYIMANMETSDPEKAVQLFFDAILNLELRNLPKSKTASSERSQSNGLGSSTISAKNVPPGQEPTETEGLMTSPQNMETV
jgi:hypothetical protein|tara:strand:+ start:32 stop:631 length:600 start_codon:yes stop_codon:yes gene_type:complete